MYFDRPKNWQHPQNNSSFISKIFIICLQGNCASIKVTDCSQLLLEWSKEAISRDEVCAAQCGFLLKPSSSQQAPFGLVPPPLRNSRGKPLNRPPRFPLASSFDFSGFKFPDLSPFISKWETKNSGSVICIF